MSKNVHESVPLFSKSIYEDAITEHIDYGVERRNTLIAETSAALLRSDSNAYPFGPMWAESRFVLEHHKTVWLQASQRSFIIHVNSPEDTLIRETSARWERDAGLLSSISVWGSQADALLWYASPEVDARMPNTCNRWQASHAFSSLLDQIS